MSPLTRKYARIHNFIKILNCRIRKTHKCSHKPTDMVRYQHSPAPINTKQCLILFVALLFVFRSRKSFSECFMPLESVWRLMICEVFLHGFPVYVYVLSCYVLKPSEHLRKTHNTIKRNKWNQTKKTRKNVQTKHYFV